MNMKQQLEMQARYTAAARGDALPAEKPKPKRKPAAKPKAQGSAS
jgi:hypothetical protein